MSQLKVYNLLGQGGYGAVYNASWKMRKVAIKKFNITRSELSQEDSIEEEIKLLERLRDKHIIQYYDTTYHEDNLVLVMEFAEGGTLQRAIKSRQLTWPDKTRIAQEIVRGLNYIHQEGVIHRDLKSLNVLLSRHREVKLCDFGLATVKMTSMSKSAGDQGLKGTLRWMAPELFSKRPKYTTKSDMYALGMVMWEMAAECTMPFQDQLDNSMVVMLVARGEREDLPDDTPDEYRWFVEQCWKQDPALRPEAHELITEDDDFEPQDMTVGEGGTLSISMSFTDSFADMTVGSSLGSDTVVVTETKADVKPPEPPRDKLSVLVDNAKNGDMEAMISLAKMYEDGDGVEQSLTEAFKWYHEAAEYRDIDAQFTTGLMYMHGRGTKKNLDKAEDWISQAAWNGNVEAQFFRAKALQETGQGYRVRQDAIFMFGMAAGQGHTEAQVRLAKMHLEGEGFSRVSELARAEPFLRQAAEQGHLEGQFLLGKVYLEGLGVDEDYDEALLWLRKAADGGNLDGQALVAKMYLLGLGVEKDYSEALSLVREPAEQGSQYGQAVLGDIFYHGWGVDKDEVEAVSWFRKAAEQKNAQGQVGLGMAYLSGRGVEQNYTEAASWFRKAAEQHDADGELNLGMMYLNGSGMAKNDKEASSCFRQSANNGSAEGQYRYGMMYLNGWHEIKSPYQAKQWFTKAAAQGHAGAQAILDQMK